MIGRREFITLFGGAAAAWPLGAPAQQPERMRRIGVLMPFEAGDSEAEARKPAFEQGLRQLQAYLPGRARVHGQAVPGGIGDGQIAGLCAFR